MLETSHLEHETIWTENFEVSMYTLGTRDHFAEDCSSQYK